jgi:hypothetical protein
VCPRQLASVRRRTRGACGCASSPALRFVGDPGRPAAAVTGIPASRLGGRPLDARGGAQLAAEDEQRRPAHHQHGRVKKILDVENDDLLYQCIKS